MTKAIFGAASDALARSQGENGGAASKTGAEVFIGMDVAGLGDKAMWTPKTGLCVLKGDTLLKVNPGVLPDAKDKSLAVARAVLPKI